MSTASSEAVVPQSPLAQESVAARDAALAALNPPLTGPVVSAAPKPRPARPSRARAVPAPTSEELERQAGALVDGLTGRNRPPLRQRAAEEEWDEEPETEYVSRSRRRKRQAEESPEVAGARRARELAAEEELLLRESEQLRKNARTDPEARRRLKQLSSRRRVMPDMSRPTDSQGHELDLRGLVPRWVSEQDHLGRAKSQRVGYFQEYGFTPVLDPHTNQPIRGMLGVLMAGPLEGYAEHVKDRSPNGALTADQQAGDLEDMVREANRKARGGRRVLEPFVHPSHGLERVEEDINYYPEEDDFEDDLD